MTNTWVHIYRKSWVLHAERKTVPTLLVDNLLVQEYQHSCLANKLCTGFVMNNDSCIK